MADVDNLKMGVGARIRRARGVLGLTQKDLCEATGMPLPSLKNYEASQRIPGGEAIAALMHAGINANWLLTGEGPMLIEDLAGAETPGALDRERMRISLKAIEMGLKATERVMAPAAKAELLLAVYDLLEDSSVTEEKVMNIVKLAA
jgi:transcriptional regulator with XRE-family HTH domain